MAQTGRAEGTGLMYRLRYQGGALDGQYYGNMMQPVAKVAAAAKTFPTPGAAKARRTVLYRKLERMGLENVSIEIEEAA